MSSQFGYESDKNEWYAVNAQNIGHHIKASNVFTLRVECLVWLFDNRYMSIIAALADKMHEALEPERKVERPAEMVKRPEGHDFGMADYVD